MPFCHVALLLFKTKNKGYRKGTGSCLCVDTEGEESEPGIWRALPVLGGNGVRSGHLKCGIEAHVSLEFEFLCPDELFSSGPWCCHGVLVGLDLVGVHNGGSIDFSAYL